MTGRWYLLWPCLAAAACASADGSADGGPDDFVDAAAPAPDAGFDEPDSAVIEMPADAAPPPPDARPAPDAAPSPDAPPCTPAWTDLLANGGFDGGATGWVTAGGAVITHNDAMPISAHGGSYAAWLAGYNNADEELYQTVAVPADATELRLSGFHCYVTADTGGANDFFKIKIRSGGGTVLETLESLTNEDVGSVCGWTSFELTAASAHAGETVQLFFSATTDASSPSSFYVDSLTFEAFACP